MALALEAKRLFRLRSLFALTLLAGLPLLLLLLREAIPLRAFCELF